MDPLLWILGSTFLVSLISFVGTLTLLVKERLLEKILLSLVSLSAGVLLGGAFLHLLPEAIETLGSKQEVFLIFLAGFSLFFVLEQFIAWHHCHLTPSKHHVHPMAYSNLLGDGVHNFVDGLVIAGGFLAGLPTGMATAFAVALHEIPQELGDFGVLVYGGFKPTKGLAFNFLSGLVAVLGGLAGYFLSTSLEGFVPFLLPFAAGNFVYVASSDLIPEIKKHPKTISRQLLHFAIFLAGMFAMYALTLSE